MTNQLKIEYRDPRSLRLHKLRKHFPAIDKEMPDWIALTDSVAASGVLQPLLITAEGLIADGGWRWEAAKDWQLKEVPVQIVEEESVGIVIAETLIARKQMTRGATVYLMMPIIKDVVISSEQRRLENIQSGRKTNEIELKPQCFSNPSNLASGSDETKRSIKDLCTRWGVSDETFRKASLVYRWLNEPEFTALKKLHVDLSLPVPAVADLRQLQEDLKLDFEHQLLIGEKNLWNVESGIKGSLTGGAHEPPQKQLELFGDALDSLAVRAERFSSPDKVVPEIRKWIKAMEAQMVEHNGRPPEEFLAKIEQVAATCDVTHKTIREFLKSHKPATTAK